MSNLHDNLVYRKKTVDVFERLNNRSALRIKPIVLVAFCFFIYMPSFKIPGIIQ